MLKRYWILSAMFGLCFVLISIGVTTHSLQQIDINILQKNDFGDGCRRYELNTASPNAHQHHHLICIKCGSVSEFADDLLENLEADIMKKSKFKITDHQVTFYGYCSKNPDTCSAARSATAHAITNKLL